jgi:hypothetical protein
MFHVEQSAILTFADANPSRIHHCRAYIHVSCCTAGAYLQAIGLSRSIGSLERSDEPDSHPFARGDGSPPFWGKSLCRDSFGGTFSGHSPRPGFRGRLSRASYRPASPPDSRNSCRITEQEGDFPARGGPDPRGQERRGLGEPGRIAPGRTSISHRYSSGSGQYGSCLGGGGSPSVPSTFIADYQYSKAAGWILSGASHSASGERFRHLATGETGLNVPRGTMLFRLQKVFHVEQRFPHRAPGSYSNFKAFSAFHTFSTGSCTSAQA